MSDRLQAYESQSLARTRPVSFVRWRRTMPSSRERRFSYLCEFWNAQIAHRLLAWRIWRAGDFHGEWFDVIEAARRAEREKAGGSPQ